MPEGDNGFFTLFPEAGWARWILYCSVSRGERLNSKDIRSMTAEQLKQALAPAASHPTVFLRCMPGCINEAFLILRK